MPKVTQFVSVRQVNQTVWYYSAMSGFGQNKFLALFMYFYVLFNFDNSHVRKALLSCFIDEEARAQKIIQLI